MSHTPRGKGCFIPLFLAAVGLGLIAAGAGFVLAALPLRGGMEDQFLPVLEKANGVPFEFDKDGRTTITRAVSTIRMDGSDEPTILEVWDYYEQGQRVRRVIKTPTRESVRVVDPATGRWRTTDVVRDERSLLGLVGLWLPAWVAWTGALVLALIGVASLIGAARTGWRRRH